MCIKIELIIDISIKNALFEINFNLADVKLSNLGSILSYRSISCPCSKIAKEKDENCYQECPHSLNLHSLLDKSGCQSFILNISYFSKLDF